MTLIPGDGIGPELAASVKEVFRYDYDNKYCVIVSFL